MTGFADSQVEYRAVGSGAWGSFRLFVGGKDVTYWRGVNAQIGTYQLIEPYSYGPADFSLPQITQFEVDQWGSGSLHWFDVGKSVVLRQVDSSGNVVRDVWRGFVSIPQVTAAGVQFHCEGEAQGRLSFKAKTPPLFAIDRTVGRRIYDAMIGANLRITPYLGGNIGVQLDGRGMSGTYLDYVNDLLAATIDTDGSQYTIWRRDTGDYHLGLKDTTTVDYTAFLGAHGVDPDLSRDMSEEPTSIYGSGVSPSGLVWVNGKYPGLMPSDSAPYPFTDHRNFSAGTTDADTDTGDGITVMIYKLLGEGYLDRRDKPGGYDSDVTEAIKDLQDDAGLTTSGTMTPNTWNALWDIGVTGASLYQAFQAPLAQSTKVKKWLLSSNGSRIARNPGYNPNAVDVGFVVDYGPSCEKSRAIRNAKGLRERVENTKNWAGTLTLTSDLFWGSRHYGDSGLGAQKMSRLDIKAGHNLMLRNFDGDTLFHVSVVNVGSDLSVQLGIDTQGRDAATLGEVIARNIESRSHPARSWKRQHLNRVNTRQIEFSEVGGLIFQKVTCPGNQWTVFPVIAGQSGSVTRVRVQTSADPAAFALAITAQQTSADFWNNRFSNPLSGASLSGIFVSDGGSGYTSATVSISGGGGSGATANAVVSGGAVIAVTMTNHGTGYTHPPTVTISGDGSGAVGQASVNNIKDWTASHITKLVDDNRALLGAWGTGPLPCGYFPGRLTDKKGDSTGDPITGLFLDDSGFNYHTFSQPVLYVAIYPDRDTVIQPQRILWAVEDTIP